MYEIVNNSFFSKSIPPKNTKGKGDEHFESRNSRNKKHALPNAIVCLLIFFACLTVHIAENPQKSIVGTYAANDNMTGEVAAFGLDNSFILYNRTVGTISE